MIIGSTANQPTGTAAAVSIDPVPCPGPGGAQAQCIQFDWLLNLRFARHTARRRFRILELCRWNRATNCQQNNPAITKPYWLTWLSKTDYLNSKLPDNHRVRINFGLWTEFANNAENKPECSSSTDGRSQITDNYLKEDNLKNSLITHCHKSTLEIVYEQNRSHGFPPQNKQPICPWAVTLSWTQRQ